jgi:hypothetical protein
MRNKMKYTQRSDPQAIYGDSNDGEKDRGNDGIIVQRRWRVAEVQYSNGKAESSSV